MSAVLTKGPEKRYATALFELAKDAKNIEATVSVVASILAGLKENKVFNSYLQSPVVSGAEKTSAVLEIAKACNANPLLVKFIKFVGQENRLDLFNGMLKNFQNIVDINAGIVKVQVATAQALTPSQQKEIAVIAKKLAGKGTKKVSIEETVNPSLIAGVRLQVGSTAWDSTIKAQLEKLKQTLSE